MPFPLSFPPHQKTSKFFGGLLYGLATGKEVSTIIPEMNLNLVYRRSCF